MRNSTISVNDLLPRPAGLGGRKTFVRSMKCRCNPRKARPHIKSCQASAGPGCQMAAMCCRDLAKHTHALKAACLLQVLADAGFGALCSAGDDLRVAAGAVVIGYSALVMVCLFKKLVVSRLEAWRHRSHPGGGWVPHRSLERKEVGNSRGADCALGQMLSLLTGCGQGSKICCSGLSLACAADTLPIAVETVP